MNSKRWLNAKTEEYQAAESKHYEHYQSIQTQTTYALLITDSCSQRCDSNSCDSTRSLLIVIFWFSTTNISMVSKDWNNVGAILKITNVILVWLTDLSDARILKISRFLTSYLKWYEIMSVYLVCWITMFYHHKETIIVVIIRGRRRIGGIRRHEIEPILRKS